MGSMLVPALIGAMVALALVIVARLMSAYFDYAEARDRAARDNAEPMLPGFLDMRTGSVVAEGDAVTIRRAEIVEAN